MGRGHQTHTQTDTRTCRLLDQLGPEGRVGENWLNNEDLELYIFLLKLMIWWLEKVSFQTA